MSSTLGWLPVKPKNYRYLDCALKHALQKRYGGSFSKEYLNEDDLGYLHGLEDAGVKDADKLISAIEKYGEIEIIEEWR